MHFWPIFKKSIHDLPRHEAPKFFLHAREAPEGKNEGKSAVQSAFLDSVSVVDRGEMGGRGVCAGLSKKGQGEMCSEPKENMHKICANMR